METHGGKNRWGLEKPHDLNFLLKHRIPKMSTAQKKVKCPIRWKQQPITTLYEELLPSLAAPSSVAVVEWHLAEK